MLRQLQVQQSHFLNILSGYMLEYFIAFSTEIHFFLSTWASICFFYFTKNMHMFCILKDQFLIKRIKEHMWGRVRLDWRAETETGKTEA